MYPRKSTRNPMIYLRFQRFLMLVTISILAINPVVSAETETSSISDNTPTSNISTITDESASISVDCIGLNKQCISKIGQVERQEADILVNLLKEARIVVLKADVQSKKLMDELIKLVIDEYYTLTEEKDLAIGLVSMKWRVVCLCFLIWSFVVSTFLLFGLGSGSSCSGPLPT